MTEMSRQQCRWIDRKGPPIETNAERHMKRVREQDGVGGIRALLHNYSRHPKGEKRTKPARISIWPEGKTR